MKIAIVADTTPIAGWAKVWRGLCEINSIKFIEYDSENPRFIDKLLAYNPFRVLWRSGTGPLKKFKDEAQRELLDKTSLRIVPNWQTHYLYDHKIRQSYLFRLHNIPHPNTSVFFNKSYALKYARRATYPFVVKADSGAGSKSFRFIENGEQAYDIIDKIFHREGKWAGREYENKILYAQEYIPASGIWRICMFKNKIAYGFYQKNKPGTKVASNQGFTSYPEVPMELFDMTMEINRRMGWDWCMYDMIWSDKYNKYLVLEICDSCGTRCSARRKLTYYREGSEWIPKEENSSPQELIFRLFVLEDMQ